MHAIWAVYTGTRPVLLSIYTTQLPRPARTQNALRQKQPDQQSIDRMNENKKIRKNDLESLFIG